MQVLQSLVLLTENTPFVIFLAIDPRVVVTAIETSSNGMYSEAVVNGHECLWTRSCKSPSSFRNLQTTRKVTSATVI